jgi:hypothetical protein
VRIERGGFERAIATYSLESVDVPEDVLAAGRASLDSTGLFLVGEMHGAAETPRVLLALARALGSRSLALEWSHDELDDVVQPLIAGEALRFDALWSLPPEAEALCGDGRVTVGHFAVLPVLHNEALLEQVILVDSSGPAERDEREHAMARRLLSERRPECPTIAALGAYHALLEPVDAVEPVGARLRRELPELDGVRMLFDGGDVWFHERRAVEAQSSWPGRELRLPYASPADVPWR